MHTHIGVAENLLCRVTPESFPSRGYCHRVRWCMAKNRSCKNTLMHGYKCAQRTKVVHESGVEELYLRF